MLPEVVLVFVFPFAFAFAFTFRQDGFGEDEEEGGRTGRLMAWLVTGVIALLKATTIEARTRTCIFTNTFIVRTLW